MDIMTALSVASKTLEITRTLWNIDSEIDKAQLKLRLRDVIDGLVQTKEALHDAIDRERKLSEKIEALQEEIRFKGSVEDAGGLLSMLDHERRRNGEPYCNLCYVRDQKLYRMRHFEAKPGNSSSYRCDNCKINVITGPALPTESPSGDRNSWMR